MARRVNPIQERQRRTALERAAYLAIFEQGYAGVTLERIAAHAGVSKGTLVYYFGTREGLLVAVMRRFVRTIAAATRRALRLATTPEARLVAYVENQFYAVDSTRRFSTVYLDFLAASTRDPALMAVQRAFVEERHRLDLELTLHLEHLPSADAQRRAWQLRALVDGLSVRFLSDPAPDLNDYRQLCLEGLRDLLDMREQEQP
ncbi:TetR family transcriptional regulator C-terminal domain-containing protein [Deinococcus sp. KNUC1210]|uniref:TetR family transcriptional regulator C-terminal domain-containing protein n=1 Tax=Deinococcus sp. KNUC1210 TaxID=2917691 RepID=UPI001EF0EFE1|nr:TetR family transcriptional regulator C-terminal domain-containing protein [Deinococcus sp. KNUC1210]ULH16928.1 TetR family transcriptional regulator C-terminal domain-containing protein [Deinococcus sp. KNUC1210]